ncbi:immunoglobulin-like domain-containing protein [Mariniflexile gromovii]|uniref:DUF5011 domain-containing protein n=1 Tax=Mariniflexile gromovii TaxID=362523 RepID=A0ABS4BS67_9FLAO|nr:immunoglobulin-like domain-containing protein [Mariniflexile gromovii]MBP0903424.1 DUF5011 domain-containing protein [Mariniflexile gromovii]
MTSCTEENPIKSDITYYADVQLVGDSTMAIIQGETFSDPGAISLIDGESVPYTTTGSVNTSTPGVYFLTYETINDDGFPASAKRTVVVLSNTPSIYNFEGNWRRSATGNATIVRISDREYTHSNAGGVDGDNALFVTFYNIDDVNLYIPRQENASVTGITVESVLGSGKIINANEINWVLNASGFYGSLLRIFKRV